MQMSAINDLAKSVHWYTGDRGIRLTDLIGHFFNLCRDLLHAINLHQTMVGIEALVRV